MFRTAFLALLPLVAIAAPIAVPPLNFTQRTLANGLRVISLEDHATPTVAIQVWYHVGSKDDPQGRSGFAHLFEHMMFKSTKRMPAETIDRLTEDVGGQNNAYTADDVTVYHEEIPSNHLERLLWAEAERMSSLIVDEANFKTERDVVKEEYRQRILAEPFGEFNEFIPKQSFKVHPYKRPTIGNIAELDASSLEDVKSFHSVFYRPDNATLVVAGDFDPKQLDAWVDRYFGPVAKPDTAVPRVQVKEPPRTAATTIREYDEKVPFPALAVTFLGPKITDEEAAAWLVLERVLSEGDAARMNQTLVYQKQIAQQAEFHADLREDLGLPTFQIVLASGIPLEQGRTELLALIEQLTKEPISERELMTARNQVLAGKLHEREKAEGKAGALGFAAVLQGDPAQADRELEAVQKVTAEQLLSLARKTFTDFNRLLIEYLPASMRTPAKATK